MTDSPHKGQFGQDKFCYETFFKNKKSPGVFLEIGASDGIKFSNSYFYEKSLGWTGLCIEPRKDAYASLVKCRNCICENTAIDIKPRKDAKFLHITGWGEGLSGLVDTYDPRHVKRISREVKNPKHKSKKYTTVDCVTMQYLLDKHDIRHIDFFSLDTEGSELGILKSIDWTKTKIDVITVENNYKDPKIGEFLKDKGFNFVKRIACDEVYSSLK